MKEPRYITHVSVFFEEDGEIYTRFVTSVPGHSSAEWKAGAPAMEFSESYAKDVVYGLTLNGYAAAVVKVLCGVKLCNPKEAQK